MNLSTSFKQNEGKSIKIKYKKLSSLQAKKNNNFIIFKMIWRVQNIMC